MTRARDTRAPVRRNIVARRLFGARVGRLHRARAYVQKGGMCRSMYGQGCGVFLVTASLIALAFSGEVAHVL